jgi:hypothetical protein
MKTYWQNLKRGWPVVVSIPAGFITCWLVGFLWLGLIGSAEAVQIGPGFDRVNLPGTIIGAIVFALLLSYGVRRLRGV